MLKEDIKFRYLVKVEPSANNNKFYKMIAVQGENKWTAEYGRVGSTGMKKIYPLSCWDEKYQEKLNDGYVDQTEVQQVVVTGNLHEHSFKPIENPIIEKFVTKLREQSNQKLKKEYTIQSKEVTNEMIQKAQHIIEQLIYTKNISDFNKLLIKLFSVLPRRMPVVSDYLAKSVNDFPDIIQNEQDLLNVMKGQVYTDSILNKKVKSNMPEETILEAMGLCISPVTHEEAYQIKSHLNLENSPLRYRTAYKVINKKTEERFQNYCKQNNISNSNCSFLYHGSRTENFWNIITSGLSITPPHNVVKTGKMFGFGSYFANKAKKSIKYTSLKGMLYTNGTSSTGLLAVYKVAVGNALDIYKWEPSYTSWTEKVIKQQGYDSVFAHKGVDLLNDEIIVYNESASTIRYIIEIEKK